MQIYKIIKLTPTKENHFAILDKSITSKSGIYLLFNKNLELIYIGKAKNIRNRICQHISENTTREEEEPVKGYGYGTKVPRGEAEFYSYILEESNNERTIKELLLITLLKPKINYTTSLRRH